MVSDCPPCKCIAAIASQNSTARMNLFVDEVDYYLQYPQRRVKHEENIGCGVAAHNWDPLWLKLRQVALFRRVVCLQNNLIGSFIESILFQSFGGSNQELQAIKHYQRQDIVDPVAEESDSLIAQQVNTSGTRDNC